MMKRSAIFVFAILTAIAGFCDIHTLQWESSPLQNWKAEIEIPVEGDFLFTANISLASAIDREGNEPLWSISMGSDNDSISFSATEILREIAGLTNHEGHIAVNLSESETIDVKAGDLAGENMAIRILREDSIISIETGKKKLHCRWTGNVKTFPLKNISISSPDNRKGSLNFASLSFDAPPALPEMLFSGDISEIAAESAATSDPLVGVWKMFDHNEEEKYASPGGDYTLGILRNGDDYDIIYLSGATASRSLWEPGMRKGRLTYSGYPGVYRAEWLDADFRPTEETSALATEGFITFSFPHLFSGITFRKVN